MLQLHESGGLFAIGSINWQLMLCLTVSLKLTYLILIIFSILLFSIGMVCCNYMRVVVYLQSALSTGNSCYACLASIS